MRVRYLGLTPMCKRKFVPTCQVSKSSSVLITDNRIPGRVYDMLWANPRLCDMVESPALRSFRKMGFRPWHFQEAGRDPTLELGGSRGSDLGDLEEAGDPTVELGGSRGSNRGTRRKPGIRPACRPDHPITLYIKPGIRPLDTFWPRTT